MKNKHPFWMKLDWRGSRPLTLRELIMKSDFGTMMKYITKFDKKMTGLDRHFFRAVEYMRHMKLRYNLEPIIAQYEYGGPFIWILEGIAWKEWLNHPIKRAKNLHCTDTELAAQCLWHLTFYGFTPEEQQAHFERKNEELEMARRNDELYLCDDIYSDEEIKEFALLGYSRVRDEVLERLFTPEEIVEIKKIHKKRLDEEGLKF